MVSQREQDGQVLVERDEQRRQERRGRDRRRRELLQEALVGTAVERTRDRLPATTAGAKEVQTDERDENQGREEVDDQQVADESESSVHFFHFFFTSHIFFLHCPTNRFLPAGRFLTLISTPTGFHDWGMVTMWAQLLITCSSSLPSTQKDRSTMRGELTELFTSHIHSFSLITYTAN